MKVLSVIGITKSGKTTTVENIIQELRSRGYSVGSVKEIHYEQFQIDRDGTNTDRHKKAGSTLVTARGMKETDVLYPSMLPMSRILSFYDHDFVILEGVHDINAPVIITAHNTGEIDERMDYRTLAVSGMIAGEIQSYKGLAVINCITGTKKLVDLIEEKVPELMPDFDADCCSDCGYDCHTALQKILSGEMKRDCCSINKSNKGNITLSVNGHELKMVPFVKRILKNAVLGVVKELDGFENDAEIKIIIE